MLKPIKSQLFYDFNSLNYHIWSSHLVKNTVYSSKIDTGKNEQDDLDIPRGIRKLGH